MPAVRSNRKQARGVQHLRMLGQVMHVISSVQSYGLPGRSYRECLCLRPKIFRPAHGGEETGTVMLESWSH